MITIIGPARITLPNIHQDVVPFDIQSGEVAEITTVVFKTPEFDTIECTANKNGKFLFGFECPNTWEGVSKHRMTIAGLGQQRRSTDENGDAIVNKLKRQRAFTAFYAGFSLGLVLLGGYFAIWG